MSTPQASTTPYPFNQKEYWKDPLLRDVVLGPLRNDTTTDAEIPHPRDGAFRSNWQPHTERGSLEDLPKEPSSDNFIKTHGHRITSDDGTMVTDVTSYWEPMNQPSLRSNPITREKEFLAPTQAFLTRDPAIAPTSLMSGADSKSNNNHRTTDSYWNWWKRSAPRRDYSNIDQGSASNSISTQLPSRREAWFSTARNWIPFTSTNPLSPCPSTTSTQINYSSYRIPNNPVSSLHPSCEPTTSSTFNYPSLTPLRRCPPEIEAHYSASSSSLVRKYHLLSLLLTVFLMTLGIGVLLSVFSTKRVVTDTIHSTNRDASALINSRNFGSRSFVHSKDVNISSFGLNYGTANSSGGEEQFSPSILMTREKTSTSEAIFTYQMFQIIMLIVFLLLYWVEVFTSSTRRLLSIIPSCPPLNEVVKRVTSATPVITFGVSCWHLVRQDAEGISSTTGRIGRCLQQHRADGFTQTEAFDFEYCRDASDSLPLVSSCNEERPFKCQLNAHPQCQSSLSPMNITTGIVILDLQLSYHLLELDTVERVNDLRERLRDSCRHRDDYFDETQWVTLPGLPQDRKSSGNYQTLHIPPLLCRTIIPQNTRNPVMKWWIWFRTLWRNSPERTRNCENDSILRQQQFPDYDWLSLSSYLVFSLFLLSWPYRMLVDSYVTRDAWHVRKIVSVHGDIDSGSEVLEDDQEITKYIAENVTLPPCHENRMNPFANDDSRDMRDLKNDSSLSSTLHHDSSSHRTLNVAASATKNGGRRPSLS